MTSFDHFILNEKVKIHEKWHPKPQTQTKMLNRGKYACFVEALQG